MLGLMRNYINICTCMNETKTGKVTKVGVLIYYKLKRQILSETLLFLLIEKFDAELI